VLEIDNVEIRIQQILPVPGDYVPDHYPSGESPIFGWPPISVFQQSFQKGVLKIEPGEMHQLLFDFILPRELEVVKLYLYVCNRKKKKRSLGWSATRIYDFTA
jgi:hypothetical protein